MIERATGQAVCKRKIMRRYSPHQENGEKK